MPNAEVRQAFADLGAAAGRLTNRIEALGHAFVDLANDIDELLARLEQIDNAQQEEDD
jgi:prefoldin subunit 5